MDYQEEILVLGL
jgi:hypothetical protein